MPGFIGFWELAALAAVLLLLFGPKRLPELGRSMGKGMREFRDSISGNDAHVEVTATPEPGDAQTEPVADLAQRRAG